MLKNDLNRAGDFKKFLNLLVKEDAKILRNIKISLKQEKLWLKKQIEKIKQKKCVVLIAEHNSRIVGITNIGLGDDRCQHIGTFGISINTVVSPTALNSSSAFRSTRTPLLLR